MMLLDNQTNKHPIDVINKRYSFLQKKVSKWAFFAKNDVVYRLLQ